MVKNDIVHDVMSRHSVWTCAKNVGGEMAHTIFGLGTTWENATRTSHEEMAAWNCRHPLGTVERVRFQLPDNIWEDRHM